MDRKALAGELIGRTSTRGLACQQLSATKFIPDSAWFGRIAHEQHFLKCYAVGAAAYRSVLVGRSAGRVQGLWVISRRDETVELTNPNGHPPVRSQWPEGVRYRHMKLLDDDIATLTLTPNDHVRVTRPVRTAIDIARFDGVRPGVMAFDSLFFGIDDYEQRQRRFDIERTLPKMSGMRGIERARQAFALSSKLSESAFESLLRVILHEHGITVQEQMWIGDYRVDFLWGQLIIEVDGRVKYEGQANDAVLAQTAREDWLREMGYEVIRIKTHELLTNEDACVSRIISLKRRSETRGPVRVEASRKRPWPRRRA